MAAHCGESTGRREEGRKMGFVFQSFPSSRPSRLPVNLSLEAHGLRSFAVICSPSSPARFVAASTASMSVRAQAAGFERVEAGDGGAAGARDHVLEAAGVLARLEQELRRAEHRLRREEQRGVAVEADLHAAVGERLDHDHDVRGAAAREAGDRVEERLVEHDDAADRFEERARDARDRPRSRACPRRSRSRPRGRSPACSASRGRGACPRGACLRSPRRARRRDRHDEVAAASRRAPTCAEHLVDRLRFHREDDHVALADERVVVARRADAVRFREVREALGLDVARDDAVRAAATPAVEEALDERAGHVAGADEAERVLIFMCASLARRRATSRSMSSTARRASCGSSRPRSCATRSRRARTMRLTRERSDPRGAPPPTRCRAPLAFSAPLSPL